MRAPLPASEFDDGLGKNNDEGLQQQEEEEQRRARRPFSGESEDPDAAPAELAARLSPSDGWRRRTLAGWPRTR